MPIRRIDTDRIIHKVEIEKIPQNQVADEEGCSPAYVCKVMKKHEAGQRDGQRSERLAELLPDRTDKERKWVEAVAGGLSRTNAALAVYDVKDRASAKTIGQRLGADPDLAKGIESLLYEEGCGRRYRVQRLKKVIDSKDLGLSIRGLDTSFKLCGDFQPEKLDVTVSYDPRAQEARLSGLREILTLLEALPAGQEVPDDIVDLVETL